MYYNPEKIVEIFTIAVFVDSITMINSLFFWNKSHIGSKSRYSWAEYSLRLWMLKC